MRLTKALFLLPLLSLSLFWVPLQAQDVELVGNENRRKSDVVVDYNNPKTYVVGGIDVNGIKYLGRDQLINLTGIQIGDKITIPSEELSSIIKRIWMQKYFSNIGLYIDSLVPSQDTVYLMLDLQERPRVSRWAFQGVKSSEQTDLREKLSLRRGSEFSEYGIRSSVEIIRKYYHEKGFLDAKINVLQENDTLITNAVRVTFDVDRGKKVKIKEISFDGIENVKEGKLLSSMKKTKDMRLRHIFNSKKFNEVEYENDKRALIEAFNEAGFRDAKIVKDSIYYVEDGRLGIKFTIDEGQQYYFRNITWTGNSLYPEEFLNQILRINKGDIYDVVTMEKRLTQGDQKEGMMTVSKLYTDNGYLFFNVFPVELNVFQDSVDVELRMVEGKPATFNNIIISGNTITNEKIVRRQILTRPGYLYSQSYFEQSVKEIASMGHFEPEHAMSYGKGYNILPNQLTNTVDVIYNVEEKPNSQFELSGGWGGNAFVGSVGISFNNFSIKRVFDKKAWRPVPLGDAQTLSIRFQTNGIYYTALSASFYEPWLFNHKPTSLSVSAYYTKSSGTYGNYYGNVFANPDEYMEIYGIAAGFGNRLSWPDINFYLNHELSWQNYRLSNWAYSNFMYQTGHSSNLSYKLSLMRNSQDQQIFPRSGSEFIASIQLTPPYSLFKPKDTDYSSMTLQDKYRWIEYHKWTFKGTVYTQVVGDLVLMAKVNFGYLGTYNRNLGYSPFEGFIVGGDGMSGYQSYGEEIVRLRGYENRSLTPQIYDQSQGRMIEAGRVYDKFTVELRYPLVLQPMSTIYALAFVEGGNSWSDIKNFNPFSVKRSAGVGVRIMLPMVGLIGIDWGYGFDKDWSGEKGGSQVHFMMGQEF